MAKAAPQKSKKPSSRRPSKPRATTRAKKPPTNKAVATPKPPPHDAYSRIIRALRRKKVYIPLYSLVGLVIIGLLLLPFLPQVQSTAQSVTTRHPALQAVAPKSFRPINADVPTSGNWLVIPKVAIKMPINEGADIDVLNTLVGVWHQTGQPADNYVLAGHKLQYGRTVNQSLYTLNKLAVGDAGVYVVLDGKATEYKVFKADVVPPTSVSILDPTGKRQLTIYTCNDFFNRERFVIMARPVE